MEVSSFGVSALSCMMIDLSCEGRSERKLFLLLKWTGSKLDSDGRGEHG